MSPEKGPFQKGNIIFQPSIFRGYVMLFCRGLFGNDSNVSEIKLDKHQYHHSRQAARRETNGIPLITS